MPSRRRSQACRNPPHTALHPPPFTAEQLETDDALGEQGSLVQYLDFLANSASVPQFVEAHASWDLGAKGALAP